MHGCISLGSWKTVLWSAELTGRVDLSDFALLPSQTALFQRHPGCCPLVQTPWILNAVVNEQNVVNILAEPPTIILVCEDHPIALEILMPNRVRQ